MVVLAPMYIEDRHCGYCKGEKIDHWALESWLKKNEPASSTTIGMSVELMNCSQYDQLMNKGFRRSGKFLYKPDLLRNCCRLYTIRTDYDQMKIVKQHRQVVNRFIRAILDPNEKVEDKKEKKGGQFNLESLIIAEQASSRFHTRFEPAGYSKEKYELYKKYQMAVHNDKESDVKKLSFERFLCETPFKDKEVKGTVQQWKILANWISQWNGKSTKLAANERHIGPTHECYYLDDNLIAISVIDFLPTGVSSVYFIWDPDYAHLSLGTLSGLREILMCKQLELGYYYLGYYIEDCQKMKYKGQFGGELLDVCNGKYYPISKLAHFIKNGRFFAASEEQNLTNICEQLFGDDAASYKEAQLALMKLSEKYNVEEPTRRDFALPNVVPGLVPLPKVLEWYDSATIDENYPFIVFLELTHVRARNELQLSASDRRLFIDTVRLLGLELASLVVLFTFP